MMNHFKVTRAHLKMACDQQNWDLLDKLLEIDNSQINDNALYTDTWGEWWGLLFQAIISDNVEGVKVLLKHGANRSVGNWGDCIPYTPLEIAADKPNILALLENPEKPDYQRKTEPNLPSVESVEEQAINQQGKIRDATGLVFQINNQSGDKI